MGKIVEVNKCLECPYQSGVDSCAHPKMWGNGIIVKIPDLDKIPDWCKLPDAKEQKVFKFERG